MGGEWRRRVGRHGAFGGVTARSVGVTWRQGLRRPPRCCSDTSAAAGAVAAGEFHRSLVCGCLFWWPCNASRLQGSAPAFVSDDGGIHCSTLASRPGRTTPEDVHPPQRCRSDGRSSHTGGSWVPSPVILLA